jgi:hypothetical protein
LVWLSSMSSFGIYSLSQWGEAIGPEYITSWLWPRTAAASERLWYGWISLNDSVDALGRLLILAWRIRLCQGWWPTTVGWSNVGFIRWAFDLIIANYRTLIDIYFANCFQT